MNQQPTVTIDALPSLLAIILLVSIVVLVIYALRSRPRLGLVAVVVAGFIAAFSSVPYQQQITVAIPDVQDTVVRADKELFEIIRDSESQTIPVAWKPEVDELYLADRYQSRGTAIAASGRHVEALINKMLLGGIETGISNETDISLNEATSIIVYYERVGGGIGTNGRELLTEIANSINSTIPETNVVVKYGSFPDPIDSDGEFQVAVLPSSVFSNENGHRYSTGGTIKLTVTSNSGPPETTTLKYDHNARWVATDVAPDSLRIRTPEFSSDRRACEQELRHQITDRLEAFSANLPISWPATRFDVHEEILNRVDSVIAKSFTQKLTNARGDSFYRAAAELDLHETVVMLHSLSADQYPKRIANRTRTFPGSSFPIRALVGLLAAVTGISIALKTVTRIKEARAHALR